MRSSTPKPSAVRDSGRAREVRLTLTSPRLARSRRISQLPWRRAFSRRARVESRSPGPGQERREVSRADETSGSARSQETPGGCRSRKGWMENARKQGSALRPGFRPGFPHDLLPGSFPALDDAISSSPGSDLRLSQTQRFPQTHNQLVRTSRLPLRPCLLRPTQSQSLL